MTEAERLASLTTALLLTGLTTLPLGLFVWLVSEWVASRSGWPPPRSLLRFGKLWWALGTVLMMYGMLASLLGGAVWLYKAISQ